MLAFPPDLTALAQVALFCALWIILKPLVFDRFLESADARKRRTQGALAEARKLREEAGRLRAEHEAALAEVRRQAARAKEEIRRQAEKEEREILEAARAEAGRVLEGLRAEMAREVEAARATLDRETEDLSGRIARTLLGRPA